MSIPRDSICVNNSAARLVAGGRRWEAQEGVTRSDAQSPDDPTFADENRLAILFARRCVGNARVARETRSFAQTLFGVSREPIVAAVAIAVAAACNSPTARMRKVQRK